MCGPFLLSYAANWTRPASVPSGAGGTCRDQLDAPASVPSGAGHVQGVRCVRHGMARALRYYRAGGRANGRHPRRASPFLKF